MKQESKRKLEQRGLEPNGHIVKVLVASPSDIAEEKDVLARAMQRWNGLHAKEGITLVPLMYEINAFPVAGGGDPQSVVNEQLVDECECGIALFHTRLGTPTPRADSGTIEEIERLVSRKKIMSVFFDVGSISIETDPDELKRVQDFKRSFSDKVGGLYGEYKGMGGLEVTAYQLVDSLVSRYLLSCGQVIPFEESSQQKDTALKKGCRVVKFGRYPQSLVSAQSVGNLVASDVSRWLRDPSTGEEYMRLLESSSCGGGREHIRPDKLGMTDGQGELFKVEPIYWRVISESERTVLLLSESLLDHVHFLERQYVFRHGDMMLNHYGVHADAVWANNWEYSSLRFWLNGEWFNDAFSWEERAKIVPMVCENFESGCITDQGERFRNYVNPTDDMVAIPSYADMVNSEYGFQTDARQPDERRACGVTDFASARGVEVHKNAAGKSVGWWWLRSPANFEDYYPDGPSAQRRGDVADAEANAKKCAQLRVCDVMEDGHICTRGSIVDGFHFVAGVEPCDGTANGVRPMIEVRKDAFPEMSW